MNPQRPRRDSHPVLAAAWRDGFASALSGVPNEDRDKEMRAFLDGLDLHPIVAPPVVAHRMAAAVRASVMLRLLAGRIGQTYSADEVADLVGEVCEHLLTPLASSAIEAPERGSVDGGG